MLPGVLYLLLESEELLSALFLHYFSRQQLPTGELWSWAVSWPKQEVGQSEHWAGQSNPGSAPWHAVTTLTVSLTTHSNQSSIPFIYKQIPAIPGKHFRMNHLGWYIWQQMLPVPNNWAPNPVSPSSLPTQTKSVCSLKCEASRFSLLLCRLPFFIFSWKFFYIDIQFWVRWYRVAKYLVISIWHSPQNEVTSWV